MKKVSTLFLFFTTVGLISCNQQQDNLAQVDRLQGKYIFIHSMPVKKWHLVEGSQFDLLNGVSNAGQGKKGLIKLLNEAGAAIGDMDFDNRLNQVITQLNSDGIVYDAVVFSDGLKNGYAIKWDSN